MASRYGPDACAQSVRPPRCGTGDSTYQLSHPAGASDAVGLTVIASLVGVGDVAFTNVPPTFAGSTSLNLVFTPRDDGSYAITVAASDQQGTSSSIVTTSAPIRSPLAFR